MRIRRATADDVDTVYRLEQAYIECPWSREDIGAAIVGETYVYLIADDGAGYAGMQVLYEDAEITNIAVVPDRRGQGIGGALLDALIGEARGRGATRLLLEVNEQNPAMRLYREKGFAPIATRKQYYKSGTAVVMAKNI